MSIGDIGLFWTEQKPAKKDPLDNPMPDIPSSDWRTPREYPDLSSATCIALDTETYDPDLLTKGPGWARGVGHIVGVSLAVSNGKGAIDKWYFPIRHETNERDNLDPESTLKWLKTVLGDAAQPKIGANLTYDLGWLRHEGVDVKGELVDVQFAEALLDESANVALETLGEKYLNEGKQSNELYDWLSSWVGGPATGKLRKYIYKAPPSLVGPYAESDADLPLRLASAMYPLLLEKGLLDVFYMECKLIRLMLDMRFAGVSVDIEKAEQLSSVLEDRRLVVEGKLADIANRHINVDSAIDLSILFDKLDLPYATTEKGNPSFRKEFVAGIDHEVGDLIREIKKCRILKGTFVDNYILDSHIDGKLYGQFHQLRSEGGGTRSGRFSSSNPNLQNIPSNDPELAPLIRGLFIPDDGHTAWRKYDYSQIEYRLLIHDAVGRAGDDIRAYFKANPDTDYHVYAQDTVEAATGIRIDRKPIKNINFGLIYGMGVSKLSAGLGMSEKEGKALMRAYFKGVP